MSIEQHYTVRQVAELLGITEDTIRRHIHSGRLHAVTPDGGRRLLIPESAVNAWAHPVRTGDPYRIEPRSVRAAKRKRKAA